MRKTIIFSLLAGLIFAFASCDKVEKDYSDADALYKKIVITYTLNDDGSINYHYKHELDLYSYYAFNRLYGETFIIYNPEYQELKINNSVTTMSDGKKVPSPDNAFNEVLPRMASGAPPYSHLREMVVTHTGLEKNSTINLDYEIKSEKGFMPFLMGNEVLSQSSPVKELIIKVRIPKDKELNYKLLNAEEDLNIARKSQFKEYEWTFNHLPVVFKERQQPKFDSHLPRLIFSTENLESAYNHFKNKLSFELPASISESVEETVSESDSKLDRIASIQKMVVNNINHFHVPIKYKGYSLFSNEKVLEDNGGTKEEKTVLFASLLKDIGIKAEPVVIIPKQYYDKKIGNLKNFEEYFVKVKHDDQYMYLSAIENNKFNSEYELPNEVALILDKQTDQPKTETWKEKTSKASYKGKLELTHNFHLKGNLESTLEYCENPYLTIKTDDKAISSFLNPGFPASAITKSKADTVTPEVTKINYTIDKELSQKTQGNYYFVDIPEVTTSMDQWNLYNLPAKRKTPLELGYPIQVSYKYTIKKPQTIKLVTKNMEETIENEVGKLSLKIAMNGEDIMIEKQLDITQATISPKNYKHFYNLINQWHKEKYQTLILQEIKK
jgi:hypothetical protein